MNIYESVSIKEALANNRYPGRGILIGLTPDGENACCAYFIMGRSANSRNRIFTKDSCGSVFTKPFDESKVEDPSLIIYAAVREYGKELIVTNGDQTDTIFEGLKKGLSFEESLTERTFEPDRPNYTPRISGLMDIEDPFKYKMSILKSIDAEGSECCRYSFSYTARPGLGHLIHTYVMDGNPLPSFQGEPKRIQTENSIEEFADEIWNSLDEDNKISLYVRYTNIKTGETKDVIINKNK